MDRSLTRGRVWLGLDFGTSSAKAVAVTDAGTVVSRGTYPYRTNRPRPGWAEQDAGHYLDAARALIERCSGAGDVAGVGLTGQNPTLVFVDEAGRSLRPAITWQDVRADREATELAAELGDPLALVGTLLVWAPGNPLARLRWIARHDPEVMRRTRWVIQPKDLVGFALTGACVSDAWSSKGLVDVRTGSPVRAALAAAGWDAAVVPPVAAPWVLRGGVTEAAAASFGLPAGTPVSVGWSDAIAPLLPLGAFARPAAAVLSGTAEIAALSVRSLPDAPGPLYGVPSSCAPMPVLYGPTQAGGTSLEWLARLLRIRVAELFDLAAASPSGDVPVFLPYLAGERAPLWRSDVRGAFTGLSLEHDAADLARAVLVGVSCSSRHVLDAASAATGFVAREVTFGGPLASIDVAARTRAAVLGMPVVVHREPQPTAVSAAMLGRCAAGASTIAEAVVGWATGEPVRVEPLHDEMSWGEEMYARYREASAAITRLA